MSPSRESGVLAAQLEAAWQWRVQAAADCNARLESGELKPSLLKRAIFSKGETNCHFHNNFEILLRLLETLYTALLMGPIILRVNNKLSAVVLITNSI
jgi:hypothetical protein